MKGHLLPRIFLNILGKFFDDKNDVGESHIIISKLIDI